MENKRKALTPEELREMDGKPVWVENIESPEESQWRLCYWDIGKYLVLHGISLKGYLIEKYGKTWFAYSAEPASLNRKAWKPCERCKPRESALDRFGAHDFQVDGAEIYFHDTDNGWESEEIQFCPWCSRPLTDEAWQMLEKRIRG